MTRSTPTAPLPYLPALDGLRAVAVTLVIVYHLDLGLLPGGFLGVDLFFVISGFLITTLLLRERAATGRVALGSFWLRRFRRLVPLLVVVVAATVAATHWWGVPEQWASVRADALGALSYVANWRFVLADQSYFETLLGPSPLLHTWSLGVEEQWYLLWPLAMIGLGALAASVWGRRAVFALLVAGIAGSSLLMLTWFTPDDPSRVYYGTDTRAQQLLVGATLAWLLHVRPSLVDLTTHRAGRWVGPAALVAFLAVAARTPDDAAWLYRGGLLALSLLAALVVAAVTVPAPPSPLAALAVRPLVGIGRRSYGLYLWHWPVVVFVGPAMGLHATGAPLVAARLAVLLALTEFGHRLVELPARRARAGVARPVLGWTTGAVATVLVAAVVLVPPAGRELAAATVIRPDVPTTAGLPASTTVVRSRPDPAAPGPTAALPAADRAPARALSSPPVVSSPPVLSPSPAGSVPSTASPSPPGSVPSTVSSSPAARHGASVGAAAPTASPATGPRTVLVLGDSTALVFVLEIPELDPHGWEVQSFSRLGCAISAGETIDAGSDEPNEHDPACQDWQTDWSSAVTAVQPDAVVVMVGAWEVLDHRVDGVDLRFPDPRWTTQVREAVATAASIAGASGAPVAFTSLPCMEQSSTALVPATARNDPDRVAAFNRIVREEVARVEDGHVLDLAGLLCPGGTPRERVGGEEVRYDGVHLSPAGSALVWDWMVNELDQLVPPDAIAR